MNDAGIMPVEYKVMVKPDFVDKKVGSIYMPDVAHEKEQMAQVKATLVAVGGNAFEDWKAPVPKPGDRVYVAKYAGIHKVGKNADHQLINDKDIAGIIVEE
jgi:co-chaperonin GroES (HSP10)